MASLDRSATPSSFLVRPAAVAVWLGLCVTCAYFDQALLTVFFGFLFALSLCSFLWGRFALSRVEYRLKVPGAGVFPGQTIPLRRTLHNGKLLPLLWLELLEPCDPTGCVVPEQRLIVVNRDAEEGDRENAFRCLYPFAMLGWHQRLEWTDAWMAKRRGIHRIEEVTIRSGDGFGLCADKKTLRLQSPKSLVVYPALTEVWVDRILRDMWDSRSSARGFLEDHTLLRSVRDYQPTDPARRINQRLLARGQGLKVNQYQVVSPDSVQFILDSASFREGEGLEESLSVLATLLTGLQRRGVRVGLVCPESRHFPQTAVLPTAEEGELTRMLTLLAGCGGEDTPLGRELHYPAPELAGQVYYMAAGVDTTTSLGVLDAFPSHKVRLLVWHAPEGAQAKGGEFRVQSIQSYRRPL